MADPIRVELAAIARIVLDRPEKQNAMNVEMGAAIERAVRAINASNETRVVLVQGEGRAFCAGGDFSLIEDNSRRSAADNRAGMLAFYRSFLSVLGLRVPAIAVLHGATVGAGLCLAMACDVRIAAKNAKMGANFVRVGLHPGMGGSLLLPRLVGPALAAELLLSGKLVTGEEAERIGLVNRAVDAGAVESAALELAGQIASAAPIAVAQAKATLLAPLLAELDRALEREAEQQAIDFATADLAEAVAAFRDGRAPSFRGA
jgi:enoyl-CoA hydratase